MFLKEALTGINRSRSSYTRAANICLLQPGRFCTTITEIFRNYIQHNRSSSFHNQGGFFLNLFVRPWTDWGDFQGSFCRIRESLQLCYMYTIKVYQPSNVCCLTDRFHYFSCSTLQGSFQLAYWANKGKHKKRRRKKKERLFCHSHQIHKITKDKTFQNCSY